MTDDEKRQQKAMLLLEHQEAEENLAHLKEKAHNLAQPIQDTATWLDRTFMPYRGTAEEDRKRDADIRANPEKFRKAMNFDIVLSLMDEIALASQKMTELTERKKALGLR